jgi:hypothetical protein
MGGGASVSSNEKEFGMERGPSDAYLTSLKNAQEGKSDKNVDMRFAIALLRDTSGKHANISLQNGLSTDTYSGQFTINRHLLNIPGEGLIVQNLASTVSMDEDVMSTNTGSPFVFLPMGNNSGETLSHFVRPADTNPRKGQHLYFVGAQTTSRVD